MTPSFHLSLPVRAIEASVAFFVEVLGATVEHRDPTGYVNVALFGCQITLKEHAEPVSGAEFHFGVNLDLAAFERVVASVQSAAPDRMISRPTVVDAGTPLERKKVYLRCPSGYLIEVKGYATPR